MCAGIIILIHSIELFCLALHECAQCAPWKCSVAGAQGIPFVAQTHVLSVESVTARVPFRPLLLGSIGLASQGDRPIGARNDDHRYKEHPWYCLSFCFIRCCAFVHLYTSSF